MGTTYSTHSDGMRGQNSWVEQPELRYSEYESEGKAWRVAENYENKLRIEKLGKEVNLVSTVLESWDKMGVCVQKCLYFDNSFLEPRIYMLFVFGQLQPRLWIDYCSPFQCVGLSALLSISGHSMLQSVNDLDYLSNVELLSCFYLKLKEDCRRMT